MLNPLKMLGELKSVEEALDSLANDLRAAADGYDDSEWPAKQIDVLMNHDVSKWFIPRSMQGFGWSDRELIEGYMVISRTCLTTAFVLTQHIAAVSRIIACENERLKEQWLPKIRDQRLLASVGISHLTTSHQHSTTPVLKAFKSIDGFVLDGFSPWVTAANQADIFVVGATLDDGRQILALVDSQQAGVISGPGQSLLGMSGSKTDRVTFNQVQIDRESILWGPVVDVMKEGKGSGTGGLQTSTLAMGLSRTAIDYLFEESKHRESLLDIANSFDRQWSQLFISLVELAEGDRSQSAEEIRQQANTVVLRATQSAMIAAKGAGYSNQHKVSRWCREALFFLVWSCPKSVSQATLCDLGTFH